jgi:chemotaxis protein CheD
MATSMTTPTAAKEIMVGMCQVTTARSPDRLWSILGSCVGVTLCNPKLQVGALSHVVLPESSGQNGTPGKFADTTIPHMLKMLRDQGVPCDGLVAKITGGSKMFGKSMPMDIGERNVQMITQALDTAGIRIAAKDVGGSKGRRVTLDCSTGELLIEVLGNPPLIL